MPAQSSSVSTGEGFRQRCRQLQNVTPQQDVTRGEAARLKEVEASKFRGSNPLSDPQSNKAIRSLQVWRWTAREKSGLLRNFSTNRYEMQYTLPPLIRDYFGVHECLHRAQGMLGYTRISSMTYRPHSPSFHFIPLDATYIPIVLGARFRFSKDAKRYSHLLLRTGRSQDS